MDDDPKQHDFDQRHDGPFDQPRPSVQFDRIPPLDTASRGRVSSAPNDTTSPHTINHPPLPTDRAGRSIDLGFSSPFAGRKSLNLPRRSLQHPRGRRSLPAQNAIAGGPDFDVRRDGPYGRPSLTMVRRRSTSIGHDGARPDLDDLERAGSVAAPDELQDPAVGFEPEPPPLSYSLMTRRWAIGMFWSLIVIDCVAMPVGLYFGLHYGTTLSPNIVFSIVTASLGGVSIFEYFLRFWRLFRHNSTCRVIGARRMYLDWFHWNFTLGWIIIMIELIVGTVPEYPPIRLLAMPVASMLYAFGTELLVVDCLRYFEVPAPVRISSIPRGAQLRPGIYSVIEDVCAVDGSGDTAFREALNKRYEASHVFRAMLRRLGVFWAFGAEGMAVLTTILVFTIPDEAAYVVGWAAPFVWAGLWAVATIWYVKYMLRVERTAWQEEIREKRELSVINSAAASADLPPGALAE